VPLRSWKLQILYQPTLSGWRERKASKVEPTRPCGRQSSRLAHQCDRCVPMAAFARRERDTGKTSPFPRSPRRLLEKKMYPMRLGKALLRKSPLGNRRHGLPSFRSGSAPHPPAGDPVGDRWHRLPDGSILYLWNLSRLGIKPGQNVHPHYLVPAGALEVMGGTACVHGSLYYWTFIPFRPLSQQAVMNDLYRGRGLK
jgi:hypothetical protein